MIARNGAVIKAGILGSIRSRFEKVGRNSCPFILGFGNKKSDADAYTAAGILPEYTFIINTSSELRGLESEHIYQTYRDPELLAYIDAAFRRPGTPSILLPPRRDSELTANEFIATLDESEHKLVSLIEAINKLHVHNLT